MQNIIWTRNRFVIRWDFPNRYRSKLGEWVFFQHGLTMGEQGFYSLDDLCYQNGFIIFYLTSYDQMVWLNWVRKLIFVCSMKLLTVVIVLDVLYWDFNDQIDMVLLDSSNKVFHCFLDFVLPPISKVARMFVQIRQEWRLEYGVIFAKLTSNDCFKQTLQKWR